MTKTLKLARVDTANFVVWPDNSTTTADGDRQPENAAVNAEGQGRADVGVPRLP